MTPEESRELVVAIIDELAGHGIDTREYVEDMRIHEEMLNDIAALEILTTAVRRKDPYRGMGYKYHIRSVVLPDDDEMEDIAAIVSSHPRCRVTIETWDR